MATTIVGIDTKSDLVAMVTVLSRLTQSASTHDFLSLRSRTFTRVIFVISRFARTCKGKVRRHRLCPTNHTVPVALQITLKPSAAGLGEPHLQCGIDAVETARSGLDCGSDGDGPVGRPLPGGADGVVWLLFKYANHD